MAAERAAFTTPANRRERNERWHYENVAKDRGYECIAGVDEAGRGPLAGPVVAAAVILPFEAAIAEIDDSKKISAKRRERLFAFINCNARSVGIGIVNPAEIDRINILQAALKAMALAVAKLNPAPDCLLIDGPYKIPCKRPQTAIPKGDARSISIAAASIVAKVTRDRLMHGYAKDYPGYGFGGHKGYPTPNHKAAIQQLGPCPIHRRSFKGVKKYF
jgi:ribonuclease HII